MNQAKREKIQALLKDPASTENEKQICRKLLTRKVGFIGTPLHENDDEYYRQQWTATENPETMIWDYSFRCVQCGNTFYSTYDTLGNQERPNLVYCDICLAALRRKAGV